ncbi:MAG TPA: coproporphyrinogen dehydrogenase HemZ [Clostridiales bacterium]|nr:coproporphyrinogen dehydrogenase HemZ [Clostridiales bacterium]
MIFVKLDEKTLWYDIYNVIRLFFSNDEIRLLETGEESDIYINDIMNIDSDYIYPGTVIKGGNFCVKIPDPGSFKPTNEELIHHNELSQYEELTKYKKLAQHKELTRKVYIALSEYTGRKMPWGMLTGVRPAKIPYEMMEEGMKQEEILEKMESWYMVSPQKASLAYSVAKAERKILERNMKDMVSLYIGIPFCKTRCLYCSFTSNCINKNAHLVDKYLESLKREIKIINDDILRTRGLKIQTIYIGGGTPTSINAQQLESLLRFIEQTLDLKYLEEYTLEAGRPDTIDKEKLLVIKDSRVSRISINPQTMNIETLNAIGRSHTPEELEKAFYIARETGFDNINMDIIVGLPGENVAMFENTLKKINSMNPENLTVHALAVKKASKLKEELDSSENLELKSLNLINDEMAKTMTDMAYQYAISMGMYPYYLYRQKNIAGNLENVGYCKPGLESIYNIQIMEEKQTIIAFGAGAVTKVFYPNENRLERAFNVKNLDDYINRVDEMTQRKKKLLI